MQVAAGACTSTVLWVEMIRTPREERSGPQAGANVNNVALLAVAYIIPILRITLSFAETKVSNTSLRPM